MMRATQTRSFGIQCDSKRSTGVQTKRLSKDEMRYYNKVIEKEKEVLLKFMDATGGGAVQSYPVNVAPGVQASQHKAKVLKTNVARKRQKRRNKRRHSLKAAHQVEEVHENGDGQAHYVSKIVVDDSTRSLKLSLKSCHPRKSSSDYEFKENGQTMECMERARSRKSKRPRRVYRVLEPEQSPSLEAVKGISSPVPRALSQKKEQPSKFIVKPESSTTSDYQFACSNQKNKQANVLSTCTNSEDGSKDYTAVKVELEEKKQAYPLTSTNERPLEQPINSTFSEEERSNCFSASDDVQSDCSEEFSIVEPSEHREYEAAESKGTTESISPQNMEASLSGSDDAVRSDTPDTNEGMKVELKKRLKANLIRRQNDQSTGTPNKDEEPESVGEKERNALPQVVSVHFYDPQNHCQCVIDPNTHITQYAASDGTHVMLNNPSSPQTSLTPPLHSPIVSTSSSFQRLQNTPSQSPVNSLLPRSQASPTNTTSTQYRYPQYHQHANGIHNQPPPVTNPQSTPTSTNNHSRSTVTAGYHSLYSPTQSVSRNIAPSPEVVKTPPAVSTDITRVPVSQHSTSDATANGDGDVESEEDLKTSESNEAETSKPRAAKRKRFIFGSHEAPRKKVISSLLTPLCEREAVRLADGIHDINMQFFPLRSLAQKAANRVSEDTDDVLKLIDQKIQLKTKVHDVEKARNLLKDIYDMVLKSKEIEDIQNFELVSHNFGVRNILNHLSLVDLYFGELGSELQNKI